jgi:hypothetical protein
MRIFLANGHSQCSGHNSALLTMAVGQLVLVFPLSRGDAPGYVERGLWPNEGALNAGAELIAESSLITKHPTNPIPASLVSLVAGVFRCPNFFPSQVMARSEITAEPGFLRASRPPSRHQQTTPSGTLCPLGRPAGGYRPGTWVRRTHT